MSEATLTLQRADEHTIAYVERLLEANDLPATDVRAKPDCFFIGYDGDDRIGIGGIEQYGTEGLLRSVIVERSARGTGRGSALCDALEARARKDGVRKFYLLTTTAAEFFENRGYVEIERTTTPASIRRTTEFEDLCPTSATCMTKSL